MEGWGKPKSIFKLRKMKLLNLGKEQELGRKRHKNCKGLPRKLHKIPTVITRGRRL